MGSIEYKRCHVYMEARKDGEDKQFNSSNYSIAGAL